VACGPGIKEMTAKILAVVAEEEARLISKGTRSALGALKEHGVKLGSDRPESLNLTPEARLKGSKKAGTVLKAIADETYKDLYSLARQLRKDGKTLVDIANHLNADGYTKTTGQPWGKVQVSRLLQRAECLCEV
jgi:DNA invertase Pin-like site-specific DNA recombinase